MWNRRPIEDALRSENNHLNSEIKKWEKFHPNDEDLLEMQKQANGSNSLAAQSVYITVLEQRVRELRSENERIKKALEKIELRYSNRLCGGEKFMYEVARDALNGGK
jgi:flagellar motility protein MotE (MotC chaperone)